MCQSTLASRSSTSALVCMSYVTRGSASPCPNPSSVPRPQRRGAARHSRRSRSDGRLRITLSVAREACAPLCGLAARRPSLFRGSVSAAPTPLRQAWAVAAHSCERIASPGLAVRVGAGGGEPTGTRFAGHSQSAAFGLVPWPRLSQCLWPGGQQRRPHVNAGAADTQMRIQRTGEG